MDIELNEIPSQFPGYLIALYWHKVEELLVNQYGVPREDARAGIKNYRLTMYYDGVGDIQYHADEKDVAAGIHRAGYIPKPKPAPRSRRAR